MAESDNLDLVREVEKFLQDSKRDHGRFIGDTDDRMLTGDEVIDGVTRLLDEYEKALFGIPEYIQAAARAHFRKEPGVVFSHGDETYAVLNDFLENHLVISRTFMSPDPRDRIVELVEINGGFEDNSAYICYLRPGDRPIYSTQNALEGADSFLSRLQALNT